MVSKTRARLVLIVGVIAMFIGVGLSVWVAMRPRLPALPPLSSAHTEVRPLPSVLLAVRDLARLESVSFHMERVIDLTEKQSRLFGLVESQDAILLVAVADVSAGVDLGKLAETDIQADPKTRTVRVRLPAPEIFYVAFDKEHTYVHTRKTDLLARRQEDLETRARNEAERALVDAAREAGILPHAGENARRVVEGLLRSLGYEHIEITLPGAG
jgi:hypothetical protein